MKYIYGPITSRRLGKSLGVNLMPHKTCSLDCIYCECGKTTNLTIERKEYTPTDEVIKELKAYLENEPQLDYITFSGSGEPTMHSGIGRIISFIKDKYSRYRVAVLTNSTLLNEAKVRSDISQADLIVPSLDAATQKTFEIINRPLKSISLERVINGIEKLREEFRGDIWLEIFIVPGVNDIPQELAHFKKILKNLKLKKVQLNTLDRPGIVDWLRPANKERLKEIASYLGDVEIV